MFYTNMVLMTPKRISTGFRSSQIIIKRRRTTEYSTIKLMLVLTLRITMLEEVMRTVQNSQITLTGLMAKTVIIGMLSFIWCRKLASKRSKLTQGSTGAGVTYQLTMAPAQW